MKALVYLGPGQKALQERPRPQIIEEVPIDLLDQVDASGIAKVDSIATSVGLVLTYRTSGLFNFAHGAVAAAGAYVFYQLRTRNGLPWPVALVVAVAIATSTSNTVVHFRTVAGHDAQNVINQVKGLVNQYTK